MSLERALHEPYRVPCDGCEEATSDPTQCGHGTVRCPDCIDFRPCRFCVREATTEASGR